MPPTLRRRASRLRATAWPSVRRAPHRPNPRRTRPMANNTLPAPEPPASAPQAARMSIFDHLGELRRRIIYSLLSLLVCACATYYFAPQIFEFLRRPLRNLPQQTMILLNPLEMFMTYLKPTRSAG
ncbi:MAG: hypothetical protein EOO40_02780 [Deltaproteobacteria bacterium]|nr:MAG: hypothetical protein EOO40_02780 [Deltaproteobacteria bacterium]